MLILNTCSFQKKILSDLTCVLIYSWTKCVIEDGSENFAKLAEIHPSRSLFLRKLQCLESSLFERSAPPNTIP